MLNECVVLLGCGVGKRLEPVSTMCYAKLHSPLLHAFSYLVGSCTIKWCAVVDYVKHLVIDLLRKILEHLLLVEYVLAEELRWTLCRCWDFDWLLLESLSDYLKS